MKTAFTMIELIFVIVVLGILAAVAMPKYNGIQLDAQIAYEKNTIGALRSTVAAIHAKSLIKNGDFTTFTDSPNGSGRATILIETSKSNYPLTLSVENAPQADTKYHLTENKQMALSNGINGSVLAVILTLSSRDNFSTGQSFTSDGVTGICDVDSTDCKQLIEGPATKKRGIPDSEEGFYSLLAKGAWVYDSVSGTIIYAKEKSNGTSLNIVDDTSPDF